MAKLSKRMKACTEGIDFDKQYSVDEALELILKSPSAKFNETIDVAVRLGVDARKSDQALRGAVSLPHGTGKTVRVAVFAQGEKATQAKEAGADIVGLEDLLESILKGELNFDVVIATPDLMGKISKAARILGPRGLMPNPKLGTVTQDVAKAVQLAKAGQAKFRTDKSGIVHAGIGKKSFTAEQLSDNFKAFMDALLKAKPLTAKGQYFKRVYLSSTMGASFEVVA